MTAPTDKDLARCETFARIAARAQRPIEECPYPEDGTPRNRVLRMRYVLEYARAGGRAGIVTSLRERVRAGAAKVWYGRE